MSFFVKTVRTSQCCKSHIDILQSHRMFLPNPLPLGPSFPASSKLEDSKPFLHSILEEPDGRLEPALVLVPQQRPWELLREQ